MHLENLVLNCMVFFHQDIHSSMSEASREILLPCSSLPGIYVFLPNVCSSAGNFNTLTKLLLVFFSSKSNRVLLLPQQNIKFQIPYICGMIVSNGWELHFGWSW